MTLPDSITTQIRNDTLKEWTFCFIIKQRKGFLMATITGLDNLIEQKSIQDKIQGQIGYLCHSASITKNIEIGILPLQRIFGKRLKCLFTPQHGLVGDVQDNMCESDHFTHSYFKLPVYSLYSETRIPTDKMLDGLDCVLIDLQDVGTRIYTYVYAMTYMMEACAKKGIKVFILDRPNPIGGIHIEGNVLEEEFSSYVGRHPCPTRHALTMGEFALMAQKFWGSDCELEVIKMQGWERQMYFEQTKLPWVMPSPNFPTIESGFPFVGTVLFEGTNISEGRGTTRSLEIVGHPSFEPYSHKEKLDKIFADLNLGGFVLRPVGFIPTFQKHQGKSCGGYQIHVTNRDHFKPWRVCQILCHYFYHQLGGKFQWKEPPYEYVHHKLPIDVINGTDKLRIWIEKNQSYSEINSIEQTEAMRLFLNNREEILLY